jgi:hypothetical protein
LPAFSPGLPSSIAPDRSAFTTMGVGRADAVALEAGLERQDLPARKWQSPIHSRRAVGVPILTAAPCNLQAFEINRMRWTSP